MSTSMTSAGLMWSVLFGSLGAGYLVYGRKQRAWVPAVCGAALIAFPYVVTGTFLMVLIGVILAVLPFVWKP